MIQVTFGRSDNPLFLSLNGHANHGTGEFDMVCAAVTSAVRLLECVVSDVAKSDADVNIGQSGQISITVKSPGATVCDMFFGFEKLMLEYQKEYPKHVAVGYVD